MTYTTPPAEGGDSLRETSPNTKLPLYFLAQGRCRLKNLPAGQRTLSNRALILSPDPLAGVASRPRCESVQSWLRSARE